MNEDNYVGAQIKHDCKRAMFEYGELLHEYDKDAVEQAQAVEKTSITNIGSRLEHTGELHIHFCENNEIDEQEHRQTEHAE